MIPQNLKLGIEEARGNSEIEPNLGMLFPANYTPLDGAAWGLTRDYEAERHVAYEDPSDD